MLQSMSATAAGLEQMAAAAGGSFFKTGGNQPEAEALYPEIG